MRTQFYLFLYIQRRLERAARWLWLVDRSSCLHFQKTFSETWPESALPPGPTRARQQLDLNAGLMLQPEVLPRGRASLLAVTGVLVGLVSRGSQPAGRRCRRRSPSRPWHRGTVTPAVRHPMI